MVVDDELLVRVGIKSLIKWQEHGYLYVGDAPDGAKAMQLIPEIQPDLIFTDIVMPNMNGLELIEQVKQLYPSIRIIVLSSHNDYEYVRKAMKLGADDYVLKTSLKPQELLILLQESADRIKVNQWAEGSDTPPKDEIKTELFRLLIQEKPTDAAELWAQAHQLFHPQLTQQMYGLMYMKLHLGEAASSPLLNQRLANMTEQQMRKWVEGQVILLPPHELILLIPYNGESVDEAAAMAEELGNDILSAAQRFLNISLSMGISRFTTEIKDIRTAYLQAREAYRYRFYAGIGKVYAHGEEPLFLPIKNVFTQLEEEQLEQLLELCDEDKIQEYVVKMLDTLRIHRMPVRHTLKICLDMVNCLTRAFKRYDIELVSDFQEETDEVPIYERVLGFEELDELQIWFLQLISLYCQYIKKAKKETYREEIQRLMDYIKANYSEDLSLKRASQITHMSESYLSFIFKKETQIGFTDFVNQVRVNKAAEYLRQTDLPSYLIAEKVGYDNINYFGRIFKRIIGHSPSQYRLQYQ